MGKIKKQKVDFNEVRTEIRNRLTEKYGSVALFLKSADANKFQPIVGKAEIKPYLYNSGAKNYKLISALCEFLGLGTLQQDIVVTRSFSYTLTSE